MLKEIKASLLEWLKTEFGMAAYDYEIPYTTEFRFPCLTLTVSGFRQVAEGAIGVEFAVDFVFKAHYRAGGEVENKLMDLVEMLLLNPEKVVKGYTVRFLYDTLGVERILDDNYYIVVLTIRLVVVEGGI